jgi:hypothetical protein
MYCPHCGNALSEEPAATEQETVETITSSEVEVARINADRDVTLAKIAAGTEKAVTEAQTDADLVAAVTEAETLGDVVEQLSPDPEPAPAAPVVVVDDGQADEPAPTDLPPAEPEHHEEPKQTSRKGFF